MRAHLASISSPQIEHCRAGHIDVWDTKLGLRWFESDRPSHMLMGRSSAEEQPSSKSCPTLNADGRAKSRREAPDAQASCVRGTNSIATL